MEAVGDMSVRIRKNVNSFITLNTFVKIYNRDNIIYKSHGYK